MPRKPNVRKAKEAPTATKKAKEFSKKSKFKSEGERRYGLAKQISSEAKALQEDVSDKQSKAKQQSLWASIGGALGGLALGAVTGGAHWALRGAAVGIGSAISGRGSKQASESKKWGGKGKIGKVRHKEYDDKGKLKSSKRFLFYDEKAKAQESAFEEFDKSLNKSIAQRSMMAGVFAGAMAGGAKAFGEYSKKIKDAREAKKAAAAASSTTPAGTLVDPTSTITKPTTVAEGKKMLGSIVDDYNNPGQSMASATEYSKHLKESLSAGADAGFDMSSVKVYQPPTTAGNLSNVITPKSAEAVPNLFSGFNKSMSDTMKKYTLATGAYSIASYRPELQKLKPMVTIPSNKRYG